MEEIKTFLNANLQVISWPAKHAKKQAVIEYMAEKFEEGRTYTESEVNEILNKFHTFNDPALLRRELFEKKFFDRDLNGGKYWKISKLI
ncbi:MAG: transcriptional regulator [Candidatus Niyogibacteria bacterium CG10_big_fil_rev_8_21_14_0_10_46_36]|uniref:Transcriptional regulator n=1 Tax=Candidatus Niyogibacteria bacterium CG10_big_fil_rev_8_21_14_0_10_46_36 TaxID=1974726 RepID=A0A2H0TEC0_9BACT|nr:MAG: transcriptional regulator [Candidatus Niyogibacteria bacterium CG10_big_fil_rev_8_21_14_0_10_46_36]